MPMALLCGLCTSAGAAEGSRNPNAGTLPGDESRLPEVVIVAPLGTGLAPDRVAARIQLANTADIESQQPLDLSDLMNRSLGSVSINHAQNNPLQPDLNFRGYTASPLLGLPQGLSVFANGARQNEVFGDTVNWDLLPVSSIHELQLIAGPNPVFGLNTIGGALSVKLKNGFRQVGTLAEASTGSFARRQASLQHGRNSGEWAWYGNADVFAEDGWRDFSASDATRLHLSLARSTAASRWDVALLHADTSLRGNGASPIELIAQDRRQVFTHPDVTRNRMTQLLFEGTRDLSTETTLSGSVNFRDLLSDTFNGDGTIFDECDIHGDEFLVEEDFNDVDGDGECSGDRDAGIELVLDQRGNAILAEPAEGDLSAINNRGARRQRSGC
jgi:iron complex outermembrane recepter protein